MACAISEKDTVDYTNEETVFVEKQTYGLVSRFSFPVTNRPLLRVGATLAEVYQTLVILMGYDESYHRYVLPRLPLSPWSMAGHSPLLRVNDPCDPTRVVLRGGSLSPVYIRATVKQRSWRLSDAMQQ